DFIIGVGPRRCLIPAFLLPLALVAGGRRRGLLLRLPRPANQVLDHRHQTHLHAVVGVVDALHAVVLQLADLLRRDGAAAAAEHADVARAALAQHVHHVLEVLHVPALVGRDGDAVGVLLQGGAHHVLDAAVVPEVHHFHALGLDQAAHDVDRRVVPVEQAGSGDEAQRAALRLGLGKLVGGSAHGRSGSGKLRNRPIVAPPPGQSASVPASSESTLSGDAATAASSSEGASVADSAPLGAASSATASPASAASASAASVSALPATASDSAFWR